MFYTKLGFGFSTGAGANNRHVLSSLCKQYTVSLQPLIPRGRRDAGLNSEVIINAFRNADSVNTSTSRVIKVPMKSFTVTESNMPKLWVVPTV